MIELKNITQVFSSAESKVEIFKEINMQFSQGKKTAILGKSGSGKSTLLHLLSGLIEPSSGEITVGDIRITELIEEKKSRFRAEKLGIVFQAFHLIPTFSALENVMLPLEINGFDNKGRAELILSQVGLKERMEHYPAQLSGGEQQRVAIARALVHDPEFILADEPSGNLDEVTGAQVMDLLFKLVDDHKKTLILVTHDADLAKRCDDIWMLQDKKFIKQ